MKELLKKSLWRGILLYVYVFLGGCLFYYIERKPERNQELSSRLLRELQRGFAVKYNISINESYFRRFAQKAFDAVHVGTKPDWGIFTGMTFTITTLTTIGYGHITPETSLGQLLTILYCLFGLPISLLTLKTFGEIVSRIVYRIVCVIEKRALCRERPTNIKLKSFFLTSILMFLTLCAGGLTQKYVEGWTFTEGLYAWFATLSTIGYGDYVPMWNLLKGKGNSLNGLWFLLYSLSLPSLAALSVVSGLLNSLVEALAEFRFHLTACYKNVKNKKRTCQGRQEELILRRVLLESYREARYKEGNIRPRSASV